MTATTKNNWLALRALYGSTDVIIHIVNDTTGIVHTIDLDSVAENGCLMLCHRDADSPFVYIDHVDFENDAVESIK